MKTFVVVFLAEIFLLILSLLGLIWPKRMQDFLIKYYEKNELESRLNIILNYMKSPTYIIQSRLIGFISLLMFIILLLIIAKKYLF